MVAGVIDSIGAQTPRRLRAARMNFYGWAIAAQVLQWLQTDLAESQASMIAKAELVMDGAFSHIIARGKQDPFFGAP